MMRMVRTAVLTGITALAVVGVSLVAVRDMHTIKIDLPDGSVAKIEYSGNAAPKFAFAPLSHAMPVGLADGFDGTPFAALDHAAAEMDRQAAAMMHETAQLETLPKLAQGKLETAALGKLPPGTVHYEFVSTSNGGGGCTRSVETISYGSEQKPRIVTTSLGDCKPLNRTPGPVRLGITVHPSIPCPPEPRTVDNAARGRVSAIA